MPILARETREFPLGPSIVRLNAPEDCECERQDDNHVIFTLTSLPECIIHLDIVQYDPNFGQYYSRNMPRLLKDIYQKYALDPDYEFDNRTRNNDSDWYRIMWRGSENIGMDVWLRQYDSWMFRVMAAKLTEEESTYIRSLIRNIQFQL